MAGRTMPGLGLTSFYGLGDNGWNATMNPDMRKLSALVQCSVLERVASLPGSPTDGDMYIVTTGGNANAVAIRDNGAWVYLAPFEGWRVYDSTLNGYVTFDGSAWVEDEVAGGSYELLATATASGSTNLDFVDIFDADYSAFRFVFEDIVTTAAQIRIYTSANSGSTWDSATNNYYTNGTAGTAIINPGVLTNGSTWDLCVDVTSVQAARRTVFKGFVVHTGAAANSIHEFTAIRNAASATNGIRFQAASGTFTSGSIHCYGLRNS